MTEDAITIETDQEIPRLQELLKKKSITFTAVAKGEIRKFPSRASARTRKQGQGPSSTSSRNGIIPCSARRSLSLKATALQLLKEQAVDQALETIRNRVDAIRRGRADDPAAGHGRRPDHRRASRSRQPERVQEPHQEDGPPRMEARQSRAGARRGDSPRRSAGGLPEDAGSRQGRPQTEG